MPINFNALPDDKPVNVPEPGQYIATIEKAEMKTPKKKNGVQGPDYLNLTLALKDQNGKSHGKVWDIISESEHELIRYKLKRFIEALEIPITGTFELKDLAKIVQGKTMLVDITKEEKEGYPPKGVVDIFSGEVYYNIAEADSNFGVPDEDVPFNIDEPDAADAQESAPETTEY